MIVHKRLSILYSFLMHLTDPRDDQDEGKRNGCGQAMCGSDTRNLLENGNTKEEKVGTFAELLSKKDW